MNLNKLAFISVLATATTAAMGQVLTGRVFNYDNSVASNGQSTYIVNGDGPSAYTFAQGYGGNYPNNAIGGYGYNYASFLASTIVNVASYVYISGNFSGVYSVQGVGAQADLARTNDIEIITNRSLTFTAVGFYPMVNNVGTITYAMSLLQDYPTNGVPLGTTGPGIDASFNGATINLNAITSLPPDGRATLRLSRTLTLYQNALGGQTYQAAGFIAVGVN